MRRAFRFLALVLTPAVATLQAQQEVENVAAFARLYGVARWFYPSDAAATLDWNRFAVHGVSQVRGARTPAELETSLEALFTPLGPGMEIGRTLPSRRAPGPRDPALIAWHYRGAGISENIRGPYRMKRTNRSVPVQGQANATGVMMQMIPADTLRGKTIRLRGRVRVADPAAAGWAGLWLRVDRGQQAIGFFDNMADRPVRDTAWREYVIEGPVASDATAIAFGTIAAGAVTVDVDAMELAVRTDGLIWTPLVIPDASFEAAAGSQGWMQNGAYAFTRPTSGAADGAQFARIAPPPTAGSTAPEPPSDSVETPVSGATIDVELARGLRARVPLSLTDAEARVPATEPPALATLRAALAAVADPRTRDDADVRLADAVVAWNVFRHFYPYWRDIGDDWDARLRPQLEIALETVDTREAHLDAVRALVADLRDGHGSVRDAAVPAAMARLPLQFRILGEQVVVTASGDSAIPVGSVVTALDRVPAAERVAKDVRLASGTPQWRRARAANALPLCRLGNDVRLAILPPTGMAREVRLPCIRASGQVAESRPGSLTELEPGIWYVDLTRLPGAQLRPALERLAGARGVVFDVRGYPTDVGFQILPHLMASAEDSTDRWMHVSRISGPFGAIADWTSMSWNVRPATPHIAARRVFLTDGRAISYAESVMGHVRDHKLGTIIGGATAGANGNVADFTVPGGFTIMFTGMRVTRHDGRTPFHMSGVAPDIPLEPTLAGIRAGRDELLERALAILKMQP